MIKAGSIAGAVMFVLVVLSAAVVSPFCALCVPVVAGLLAGYLTGVFEKPAASEAAKRGAGAGAIAGGMAILGNIIAGVINAAVMQNPEYQINNLLGLPTASPTTVWVAQLAANLCIGVFNVGLNAALGAGGAAIWIRSAGRNPNITPSV